METLRGIFLIAVMIDTGFIALELSESPLTGTAVSEGQLFVPTLITVPSPQPYEVMRQESSDLFGNNELSIIASAATDRELLSLSYRISQVGGTQVLSRDVCGTGSAEHVPCDRTSIHNDELPLAGFTGGSYRLHVRVVDCSGETTEQTVTFHVPDEHDGLKNDWQHDRPEQLIRSAMPQDAGLYL